MYKITILTKGKYDVTLGDRYALTKRNARELINYCFEWGCDFAVAKFIRCGGVFCWSSAEVEDDLFR